MVRILYGVMGVGFGHSSRADTIASILEDEHEILFASSNGAYDYLSKLGKNVAKIHGFNFSIKDNKIEYIRTFYNNALKAQDTVFAIGKVVDICKEFKPDIIISDFEPFTAMASKFLRKPLISIDHQHIISNSKIEYSKKYIKQYQISKFVSSNIVNHANSYIISSFFFPHIIKKNTIIIPPLIRKEILETKTEKGPHTLVYMPYEGNIELFKILREIENEEFIVYGAKKESIEGNLHFKNISKEGFIKDLSSSKAVISNGGYSLISEALHLKKPILTVPLLGQFEQVMNAYYLEKLNYGKYYEELDEIKIIGFLNNLAKYKRNLEMIKWNGKKDFKKVFDNFIYNISLENLEGDIEEENKIISNDAQLAYA
ncbi:MAG: undecaprenyldiphospho-muramoylpentapeptide beta-N-acetylglucosaminyltransferase [Candidatus Methanofastidiosum methylothiophilum]|uniref:Undecaprenyldiphospho-muramoylpentapeptide beta-N-acetylglucosaminyltransferase n=1 Tax=Candidatus Methanofastidiosum methylothiophilum TaxID=1705564 RepID=A0A150J2Y0_9EURY|nr:MAG: undecaprenyldiphospho-muramoylpentapeptide beta-N-acetylglucosaminyltransferase [Candidatus Methanofastidiosum methylthiophilus]